MGCKFTKDNCRKIEVFWFYINYMGCKLINVLVLEFQTVGFILTIWDVNLSAVTVVAWSIKFYINYMGCKFGRSIHGYGDDH